MYSRVSRRYSQALYDEAKNTGKLSEIAADRDMILNSLRGSRELELFFQSPIIDKIKKEKVVKELFGGKVSPLMLNFLLLLIMRQRESLLVEILDDFKFLRNEKEGIVEVKVTTAVSLSSDEKKSIIKSIDSYTHLQSEPEFYVDKNIIGGFVVKIKDTILDASIKRQLELLKKKFKEGGVGLN